MSRNNQLTGVEFDNAAFDPSPPAYSFNSPAAVAPAPLPTEAPPLYSDLYPSGATVPAAPLYVAPAEAVGEEPSAPPESRPTTAAAIIPHIRPSTSNADLPRPSGGSGPGSNARGSSSNTSGPSTASLPPKESSPRGSTTPSSGRATSNDSSASNREENAGRRANTTRNTNAQPARRKYDYTKLDDRYCYCETFRCWPRKIPKDKPNLCSKNMKQCRFYLIIFLAIFLFTVIFFPVTYTSPQCEGYECTAKEGQSDRKCIRESQQCDGVNQCPNYDDESGCFPRVLSISEYVLGYIGDLVEIDCEAVRATHNMEWYAYDQNTRFVSILWSEDHGLAATGYAVDKHRAHYDLRVRDITSAHVNHTYGVRFDLRSTERHSRIIPIENTVSCPSETWTFQEGDTIELSASVQYYGDQEPLVLWYQKKTGGPEESLTSEYSISSAGDLNTITVNVSLEAQASHNGSHITVYIPAELPYNMDKRTPARYLESCENLIVVKYSPRSITFEQNTEDRYSPYVSEGVEVKCIAMGNPTPNLYWSCYPDSDYTSFEASGTFVMPDYVQNSMLNCTCDATNTINGVNYTESQTFVFRSPPSSGAFLTHGSILASVFLTILGLNLL